jgi:ferredoxin-NADP reductase
MRVKIKNKKEIAKNTLLVDFDISEKEISFKPGQYFFITLINPPYTDKKGNQRHFSIVNSPNERGVLTMTTRIRDSAFKRSLFEIPVGAEVEIGIINGSFILPDDESQPIVFIAGGIGITPFISMLRYVSEEDLDYKITLLYSNRDRESTAFLGELKNIAKNNPKFGLVLTMTDDSEWRGEKRRIDAQFIKEYIPEPKSCFYLIAGPPTMVKATHDILSGVGVEQRNIKAEDFSGY